MKMVPLGDKVVVQRLEAEETTSGGIVLPNAARERPAEGRILSVGTGIRLPGGSLAPFQVQEGDRVLFTPHAGTEIDIDGETLLVLREADLLAVLSS
jgi:chaperonin GroES